jgi:hypothetical protein
VKKGVATNLILGGIIVLLCGTNVITIGALLWQRLQMQKLRQQIVITPPSPQEVVTATDVCQAAQNGDLSRLKRLLDKHPELLDATAGPGHATPLHHAVYYRRPAIVDELLRRKADVNALNGNGATALHDCVSKGTLEMAAMLLDHGADVNIRNYARQNPLAMAVAKDRSDMAELLRQRGAKD